MKIQIKNIWTPKLKVADFHSEPEHLQTNWGHFNFFHFLFIFLACGTWNPGKPWTSTKKHVKPSETKENEEQMKIPMKNHEKQWKPKWLTNDTNMIKNYGQHDLKLSKWLRYDKNKTQMKTQTKNKTYITMISSLWLSKIIITLIRFARIFFGKACIPPGHVLMYFRMYTWCYW